MSFSLCVLVILTGCLSSAPLSAQVWKPTAKKAEWEERKAAKEETWTARRCY